MRATSPFTTSTSTRHSRIWLTYSPYIGDLSLRFQPASRGARGGILADEMGLGKTIMVAALIHANRDVAGHAETRPAVSYTHLTLPTICSG